MKQRIKEKINDFLFNHMYPVWNFVHTRAIRNFLREMKYAYQRARYTYSDDMFWKLDDVIKQIYIRWLKDLSEKGSWFPTKYENHASWQNELNNIRMTLDEEEPCLSEHIGKYSLYLDKLHQWNRRKVLAYKKLADLHWNLWD